ncbi:hypothetical protein KBY27_11715 [Ruegeria pomeroyi]|uniref:Uncharacterized protein n=1 Tax=Ruegeria pomeroyi TaxID=89184 RepID=A0A9Q3WL71_9RHOB|nr:hypothetical protein [Ruegeria pomeroyi]MCE8538121.1 hypothetical protein [Ruegeria pomeroyi]
MAMRLPIQQRKRDRAKGLNAGGYISGYRGSPVGTYDMRLRQAAKVLKENNIYFQPGVNEDLAVSPDQMRATRIAMGEADALIGCDLVAAAGDEALSKLTPGKSVAVTDTTAVRRPNLQETRTGS